jgi:hypothetical protein
VALSIRKKLPLTLMTSSGRSIGIVRLRTEATEFFNCVGVVVISWWWLVAWWNSLMRSCTNVALLLCLSDWEGRDRWIALDSSNKRVQKKFQIRRVGRCGLRSQCSKQKQWWVLWTYIEHSCNEG